MSPAVQSHYAVQPSGELLNPEKVRIKHSQCLLKIVDFFRMTHNIECVKCRHNFSPKRQNICLENKHLADCPDMSFVLVY